MQTTGITASLLGKENGYDVTGSYVDDSKIMTSLGTTSAPPHDTPRHGLELTGVFLGGLLAGVLLMALAVLVYHFCHRKPRKPPEVRDNPAYEPHGDVINVEGGSKGVELESGEEGSSKRNTYLNTLPRSATSPSLEGVARPVQGEEGVEQGEADQRGVSCLDSHYDTISDVSITYFRPDGEGPEENGSLDDTYENEIYGQGQCV